MQNISNTQGWIKKIVQFLFTWKIMFLFFYIYVVTFKAISIRYNTLIAQFFQSYKHFWNVLLVQLWPCFAIFVLYFQWSLNIVFSFFLNIFLGRETHMGVHRWLWYHCIVIFAQEFLKRNDVWTYALSLCSFHKLSFYESDC